MSSPSDAEALEADFWAFACALYDAPGVAGTCLALQDDAGLDVNLVLLCCWLAARGRGVMTATGAAQLRAASSPWQHAVLAPLRAARRRLKTAAAKDDQVCAARGAIAALELRAERVAQALLIRALPAVVLDPPQSPRADAAASLAAYAADALDPEARECLLKACVRVSA